MFKLDVSWWSCDSDVTEELRHLFGNTNLDVTIEKDEINTEDYWTSAELEVKLYLDAVQILLHLKLLKSFSHLQKAQAYQSEFYLSIIMRQNVT